MERHRSHQDDLPVEGRPPPHCRSESPALSPGRVGPSSAEALRWRWRAGHPSFTPESQGRRRRRDGSDGSDHEAMSTLRFLPCLDSPERAERCRSELGLRRDLARDLGRSSLEASEQGFYETEDGRSVQKRPWSRAADSPATGPGPWPSTSPTASSPAGASWAEPEPRRKCCADGIQARRAVVPRSCVATDPTGDFNALNPGLHRAADTAPRSCRTSAQHA